MGRSKKLKKSGNIPTILLTAEPSNFSSIVQKFTGRPKHTSIEGSLLLKPVPTRPEAKQFSATTCQWFSSLSSPSSTTEALSPQPGSSFPLVETFLKDLVDDEEQSVGNSSILREFLDIHNDIVSLDSGELQREMESLLG